MLTKPRGLWLRCSLAGGLEWGGGRVKQEMCPGQVRLLSAWMQTPRTAVELCRNSDGHQSELLPVRHKGQPRGGVSLMLLCVPFFWWGRGPMTPPYPALPKEGLCISEAMGGVLATLCTHDSICHLFTAAVPCNQQLKQRAAGPQRVLAQAGNNT